MTLIGRERIFGGKNTMCRLRASLGRLVALAFVALTLALTLAGCQSAATLSMAVRTGDTVLVGLSAEAGKQITNTTASVIRPQDVSARITDNFGTSANVVVRSVFRVYGDPTANPLSANQAQWLAVIDLVDAAENPVNIMTGPATLRLTSAKFIEPMEVSTTILEGTGSPHPLTGAENTAEKLGWLRPPSQARVRISGSTGGARLGAVQYRFRVSGNSVNSVFGPLRAIDGIKMPGRRDVSFQRWINETPGAGTVMNVVMTAPEGIEASELDAFDVALVSALIDQSPNPTNYFVGSLESAVFYNLQGFEIGGLAAQVGPVQ